MAEEPKPDHPVYKIILESSHLDLGLLYTHNFAEFFHGKPIPEIFGKFHTYTPDESSAGEKWPDLCLFGMHWALVSNKMRKAIERFTRPDHFQFLDAQIGGANVYDYKLFNCLQHVNCLNNSKSNLASPQLQGAISLRAEALIGVSGAFRAAEYPLELMVTENLHNYCLSEGLGPLTSESVEII